jgi:hypothetical protein
VDDVNRFGRCFEMDDGFESGFEEAFLDSRNIVYQTHPSNLDNSWSVLDSSDG